MKIEKMVINDLLKRQRKAERLISRLRKELGEITTLFASHVGTSTTNQVKQDNELMNLKSQIMALEDRANRAC